MPPNMEPPQPPNGDACQASNLGGYTSGSPEHLRTRHFLASTYCPVLSCLVWLALTCAVSLEDLWLLFLSRPSLSQSQHSYG